MDAAKFTLFLLSITFLGNNGQVCKVTNVQIESEDGRQQFIELNLKRVDVKEKKSCPGCNLNDDSKSWGYLFSDNWSISVPPSFNLVFTPGELIQECDYDVNGDLPYGLCWRHGSNMQDACTKDSCEMDSVEEIVDEIEDLSLLPFTTGKQSIDRKIAAAMVILNTGKVGKAIEDFSSVIYDYPSAAMAYFGRGAAHARKGLQDPLNAANSLKDFTKAIQLSKRESQAHIFIHRAEVLMMLHRYPEAHEDVTTALKIGPTPKMYFLRGIISILLENFADAEKDFRKNLQIKDEKIQTVSHFHLGIALLYRGKVRNAVEVFKEILKNQPNNIEASLSLAQGFKELGNLRAALNKFGAVINMTPNSTMPYVLKGSMLHQSGDMVSAITDFEKCLEIEPNHANCLYLKGISKISNGKFYEGVKDATKVMVSNIPSVRASPEFIKAHYLREYARYIHTQLDNPISSIQPDVDFSPDYIDNWVKLKPFDFKNYKEQPGLQPEIGDVYPASEISSSVKTLICQAESLGKLSQITVDGIIPNRRLNLAMGLASLHTAQIFEAKWRALKNLKMNSNEKVLHSWKELFSTAIYYRRLAHLDHPYLWVEILPDYAGKEGYRSDIPFVRGSVINNKVIPYYELAFKLTKTMLEHFSGEESLDPSLKEEIAKAKNCEELLNATRLRQINPHGFLVSTQVPSLMRFDEDYRLDGGVLMLTNDLAMKTVFSLNIANTPDRTASYSSEMDHLLNLLQEEIRKMGSNRAFDSDAMITHILSLMYYFYNLVPLSRGSSAVAYSVMLGLLLSVGRQITGRIPHGRLLDMEAMLSGAPNAFIVVAQNWMLIKKNPVPVSSLPKVWEVFPTVRSVMEVLALNNSTC